MEYEVSIRIVIPEAISNVLKKEKERFVAGYGSSYKSEPHITLYLDRYTPEGFPRLIEDLRELRVPPFSFSLLQPKIVREEHLHRNLYVMDVSNKAQIQELHDKISEIAVRYRSPLMREKTRQRLERQGIHTDGTRESVEDARAEMFDPHITLGEIDFDRPQAQIVDAQKNLKQLEGQAILVSDIVVFLYGKEQDAEKAKLLDEVTVLLDPDRGVTNSALTNTSIPDIIKEVGFDFDWDEKKVWALDVPATELEIEALIWHFDIPFLWHGGGVYNLAPRDVIENPEKYTEEYERMMRADLQHPIDVMENEGRLLILDGLHRLMKAFMQGQKKVYVRIVPRSRIPDILTK